MISSASSDAAPGSGFFDAREIARRQFHGGRGDIFLEVLAPFGAQNRNHVVALRDTTLRELGVGFVPFSPLGRGLLSGALSELPADDMRRKISPRFEGDNLDRNLKVVARLKAIAGEKGITPSQLALAWVLAQGNDMVPIPGTKRRKYLEENIAAAAVELSPSDLARIEEAAPRGFAAGGRYHDMSTVNI